MNIESLAGKYCILSTDEEDFEVEIYDTIEYENNKYICAFPVDEPESEYVYIIQENIENDLIEYLPVEDENLLNIIFDEFMKRNQDVCY